MDGNSRTSPAPLQSPDGSLNDGCDSEVVAIKVEPVSLEEDDQTVNLIADDMRHVHEDDQPDYGCVQNVERRNEGLSGLSRTDTFTSEPSPVFKDQLADKDFASEIDDLSEPSVIAREVAGVDVSLVNSLHGTDYENGRYSASLSYETAEGVQDPEVSIAPSPYTESGIGRPYTTRVRPVKGPASCVMLTSSRGYIMLLADSYRYGKERNRGNRHYWRCRVRGCHGRAVTVRDHRHQHTLVSASLHSHPPPDGNVVQACEAGESNKDSKITNQGKINGANTEKTGKTNAVDRTDDDVFFNGVEEDLPVFADDETPSVFPSKEQEKEEICRTVLPKRGRLTLIAKQFMYGRDRCRNDRHYWRCRIRQCHGRAVTKYDANGNHVLVASTPHSHSPTEYPESVMSEAMESRDRGSPLAPSSQGGSIGNTKLTESISYHNGDETPDADEGQLSPEHFSDIDLTYSGFEGLKESITIVHPKEIGEDCASPSRGNHYLGKGYHPQSKDKIPTSRYGSKSFSKLDMQLPNGSPDVDDSPLFIPVQLKERKRTGSQSDAPRPRILSHQALDYEPLSDTDYPIEDESCLCLTGTSLSRELLESHSEFGDNHHNKRVSLNNNSSSCHLLKSDNSVWYLVAKGYAHLKDNIQRDRHFWKCHYRHCNGQAITRLHGNTHTLIGFALHHHSPMTTVQDLKQLGLEAQGMNILSLTESEAKSSSVFVDLNSQAFSPGEGEPLEICKHVMSRRGKHILLARGYSFGIERNRNDRYYWRCKIRGCRGRAVTKILGDGNHALLHFANHVHPPLTNHESCVLNYGSEEQDSNSSFKDHDNDSFDLHDNEVHDIDKTIEIDSYFSEGKQLHKRSHKNAINYGSSHNSFSGLSRFSYCSPELPGATSCYTDRRYAPPKGLSMSISKSTQSVPHNELTWNGVQGSQSHGHSNRPKTDAMDNVSFQRNPVLFFGSVSSPPPIRIQDVRHAAQSSQTSPIEPLVLETSRRSKRFRSSDEVSLVTVGGKRSCFNNPSSNILLSELKLGEKIIEGKTKVVYALPDFKDGGYVLLESKDRITCGDGARADDMQGKAELSTATTCAIFEYLNHVGIKTHFLQKHTDTKFIAQRCEMVPLEFVTRRIATGSFLRRNPGVKEGFRFAPPLLETFFKDDANHDPQWSREQCLEAKLKFGGVSIGRRELDIMNETTLAVFEILEKAWAFRNCVLVDMKVEFGINPKTKEILLADVIDNDSWRLWPGGDKRLMRDKQVYRNLREVTPLAMEEIKKNYKWVADETKALLCKPNGRIVIFMGSASDKEHALKIQKFAKQYGVPSESRVTSAHKGTEETLKILREYEGHGVPTVFIAIAGRSNGLGPVLSGNTAYPVINCPPIKADWGTADIWSSLRLPSGLGCTTVMDPQAAALAAAQIIGLNDHVVWSTMRANRLCNLSTLMKADCELESSESS